MTHSVPPNPGRGYEPPVPSASDHYRSPREEYRRARTRSQTVVFGSALIGLAVIFMLGFLGVSGALPIPFGGEFSKKLVLAEAGDIPCPTQGARASSPDGVQLRVLNTTSIPGLAGSVAATLEELGYTILATDNSAPYHGIARIEAGPYGVDAAYSLARYFQGDVRVVLSSDEGTTLTVLLGTKFDGLVPADEQQSLLTSTGALIPPQGCLPLGELPQQPQSEQSGAQSGQSGDEAEQPAD